MPRVFLFFAFLINLLVSSHVNATVNVLRIAGFKQNTPYVTVNDKNIPNGFAVQLLTAILDDMDYQYEITLYDDTTHTIEEALAQNDILLSQRSLPRVSKEYYFSTPYHSRRYDILCRKGGEYKGPADLLNKNVIIRQDTHIYEKLALLGADNLNHIILVENIYDGIKMLSEGIRDYLICDANLSLALNQQKALDNLVSYNSGFSDVKACYVGKDLDLMMAINRTMIKMHEDGRYNEIYDKWLGVKKPFLQTNDLYLLFVTALCLFIVFAILYWVMRRRALNATNEILKTKNQIEGLNRLINTLNNKIGTEIFINNEQERCIYHLHNGTFRLYNLDYEEFLKLIHPDDLLPFINSRLEFVNGKKAELNLSLRIFNVVLDKYCHYNFVACPLEYAANNHVNKYICSLHNDTKQQELIRRQDELIHTLNMGISTAKMVRWQYDFSTDKLHYTDTSLNEFTLTAQEALQMTMPEDQHKLKTAIARLSKDETTQSLQLWQKYGCDHDYKLYEVNCMINFDKDKQPISIFGIARDISEIYNYQRQLKEKIGLLETIKNYMPVGMYIYDSNGQLMDVNDTQVKFIGLDREKLLKGDMNLFDMTYIEAPFFEKLRRGETVSKTLYYEDIYPILKQYIIEGAPHSDIFDVVCAPIKNSVGDITGYITIYYDATERNKNRREIQYLYNKLMLSLDSGDMSAWRYDCTTDLFTTIHGRRIGKESLTMGELTKQLHPDDRDHFIELINHLKAGMVMKDRCEIRLDYGKGMRWYRFSLAPEIHKGKVNFINGTWKDVNEEVLSREALQVAKQKAEESERLKMAFLANMSHEIRTPLNAIVGFSELLQYTNSDEERQQFIDIIHNNNDLLLSLINDILDLSKIESGLTKITNNNIDVGEVFHQTYSSFDKRLKNGTVQLIDQCDMMSCVVNIDRSRFTQVLNNLISNAIKYTNEGTITMNLTYDSGGVRITVKDTGIGISPDNHKYVFQRFQKFDSFAQGTGLGLAISKAITEMMGGEIGFTSEENVGSEFWAWFPCNLISKE